MLIILKLSSLKKGWYFLVSAYIARTHFDFVLVFMEFWRRGIFFKRNPFFSDLGKKVLIVYAHQEPRSFNGSLKKVAVDELSAQGCTVTVSDLYAMDFEPRATRKDITGESGAKRFFFLTFFFLFC